MSATPIPNPAHAQSNQITGMTSNTPAKAMWLLGGDTPVPQNSGPATSESAAHDGAAEASQSKPSVLNKAGNAALWCLKKLAIGFGGTIYAAAVLLKASWAVVSFVVISIVSGLGSLIFAIQSLFLAEKGKKAEYIKDKTKEFAENIATLDFILLPHILLTGIGAIGAEIVNLGLDDQTKKSGMYQLMSKAQFDQNIFIPLEENRMPVGPFDSF